MVERQVRGGETNKRLVSSGYRDTPTYSDEEGYSTLRDEHILRDRSTAGTSGQEGAGKTHLPPVIAADEATLGTEDGLVANDTINENAVDPLGYLEGTDTNTLAGDLPDEITGEIAESSTAYPSIAGAAGTQRDTLEHDADTPLTTMYPNNTPRLRDTPV